MRVFKSILLLLTVFQGVSMSALLDKVEINGVEVPLIFEEERLLPIASMQVVFRYSGSLADDGHAGLAKFSARMMNEGTKAAGSIGFAKALEERAISLGAHTGTEGSLMRKESDYDYQASLLLKKLLFEGTPLANPADGTVEGIESLKLEQVEICKRCTKESRCRKVGTASVLQSR